MKHLGLMTIGLAAAVLFFSSCKRADYTCQCTIYDQGVPHMEDLELGLMSNNAAQKRCNDYQESRTSDFRGTTRSLRCRVIND